MLTPFPPCAWRLDHEEIAARLHAAGVPADETAIVAALRPPPVPPTECISAAYCAGVTPFGDDPDYQDDQATRDTVRPPRPEPMPAVLDPEQAYHRPIDRSPGEHPMWTDSCETLIDDVIELDIDDIIVCLDELDAEDDAARKAELAAEADRNEAENRWLSDLWYTLESEAAGPRLV